MVLGLIKLFGIIVFLYLIWRNLYDDYRDDLLISYGWGSMLTMLLGGRIVYGLWNWGVLNDSWINWLMIWKVSGFNFYGGIATSLIWTVWFCVRNEWKVWQFLEDVTPIYYLFLAFINAEEYVKSGFDAHRLILMLVAVVGYLLSNFLKGRYRSFTWYKSGKKGFIFFAVNMIVSWLMAGLVFVSKEGWAITGAYLVLGLIFGGGGVILGEVFNSLSTGRKTNGSKN